MTRNPCAKCGNEWNWTGQQYQGTPEDYDGTSEWICNQCGTRWGRWTGRELKGDEIEPRYGRSSQPVISDNGPLGVDGAADVLIDPPLHIKGSYTLGESGTYVAHNIAEFVSFVRDAMRASPVGECLVSARRIGSEPTEGHQ